MIGDFYGYMLRVSLSRQYAADEKKIHPIGVRVSLVQLRGTSNWPADSEDTEDSVPFGIAAEGRHRHARIIANSYVLFYK